MSIAKYFAVAALAATTSSAFADAANLLISFSTVGPDYYADGKTVAVDGEWYALCWTPNETFGGITTDFTPAVAGDKIMKAANNAKNGCCPPLVFQIDSADRPKGGKFFVYLLDTRDANGKPAGWVKSAEGKWVPSMINGSIATAKFTATSSAMSSEVTTEAVAGTWGESVIDTSAEGFKQPKIAAFAIDGDKAIITVTDMMSGIKYNVQAGEKIDTIESCTLKIPLTKDQNDVSFEIDKEKGKFFKVTREPLAR